MYEEFEPIKNFTILLLDNSNRIVYSSVITNDYEQYIRSSQIYSTSNLYNNFDTVKNDLDFIGFEPKSRKNFKSNIQYIPSITISKSNPIFVTINYVPPVTYPIVDYYYWTSDFVNGGSGLIDQYYCKTVNPAQTYGDSTNSNIMSTSGCFTYNGMFKMCHFVPKCAFLYIAFYNET